MKELENELRLTIILLIPLLFLGCSQIEGDRTAPGLAESALEKRPCTHDDIYNPKFEYVESESHTGYVGYACSRGKTSRFEVINELLFHQRDARIELSPNGQYLALALNSRPSNELLIYDLKNDKVEKIQAVERHYKLAHPSLSSDGKLVAFYAAPPYYSYGQIIIVDRESGQIVKTIRGKNDVYGPYAHLDFGCNDQCLFYAKDVTRHNISRGSSPHFRLVGRKNWGIFVYDLTKDVETQIGDEIFGQVDALLSDGMEKIYVDVSRLKISIKDKIEGFKNWDYLEPDNFQLFRSLYLPDLPENGDVDSHFGKPYSARLVLTNSDLRSGEKITLENFVDVHVYDYSKSKQEYEVGQFYLGGLWGVDTHGDLIVFGGFPNPVGGAVNKNYGTYRLDGRDHFFLYSNSLKEAYEKQNNVIVLRSVIGRNPEIDFSMISKIYNSGPYRHIGRFERSEFRQDMEHDR